MSGRKETQNRYSRILEAIFKAHFKPGMTRFEFDRDEIVHCAHELGIDLPKNLGDLLYSFRFRSKLPHSITCTASRHREWTIELAGKARYCFILSKINRITPSPSAFRVKIPDSTPEIIAAYAKTDEQALLARVRYNRLIDIFLRATTFSLQSHLRTTVPSIGQIEIDEVYVGVRNTGEQFIIPVQAKGGGDQLGAPQVKQDLEFCKHAYPNLTPRAVAVQFIQHSVIAMFELVFQDGELKVIDEKHYQLVNRSEISEADLAMMSTSSRE